MDGSKIAHSHNPGNPPAPYRGDLPAAPINPLEPLVGGPTLREDRAFQFLKILADRAKSPVAKPGQAPASRFKDGWTGSPAPPSCWRTLWTRISPRRPSAPT